jgi:hypothetical protein
MYIYICTYISISNYLFTYLVTYCSAISHKGIITLLVFLNLMRKSLLVIKSNLHFYICSMSGYICSAIYKRDGHIVELQLGKPHLVLKYE